jgi:hypothetical protein
MEPKRWVLAHESADVRLALRAGIAMEPPPEAEGACWSALGAALAGSVVLGAAAEAAASSASVSAAKASSLTFPALLKLFGIGASVGVLATGGIAVVSRAGEPEHPAATTPVVAKARSHGATTVTPPSASAETKDVVVPPHAREPKKEPQRMVGVGGAMSPPQAGPASAAIEESELVLSARDALRAGDPQRALAILGQAQRAFGAGALAEERLALAVDAWMAAGRVAEGKRAARLFLERYPRSAHAARFETLP